jgi:hypothetical protein
MSDPSVGAAKRSWDESDLPLLAKAATAAKNTAKKLATLSQCCGNPGEPGC